MYFQHWNLATLVRDQALPVHTIERPFLIILNVCDCTEKEHGIFFGGGENRDRSENRCKQAPEIHG